MFCFAKDRVFEKTAPGVERAILVHEGAMMCVENRFEKGGVGAMHSHPHEQVTYVLSGKFEFTIGDEKHVVTAGDTLHKLPNVKHGCVCLEKGVLIDVFTPQREDFLKKG
ncbi:MAG: cupin domain-containing protein [Succinivibrio sp.]|jgi:quercetin dioxygenase-like cupin family protein|nr:cupin domain-containing protein [Succinivibrio sp.]